jgi:hypothetical protein
MYDDEGYYVVLPDPDTLPEPHFAGLTWEQIKGELERLEYEQWEQEMYYREQDQMWHEENGWGF